MIKGRGGVRKCLSLLFSALLSLQLLGVDAPRALAESLEEKPLTVLGEEEPLIEEEVLTVQDEESVLDVSWFSNEPQGCWDGLDAVGNNGHYEARALFVGENETYQYSNWENMLYNETSYRLDDFMKIHGSGTYGVEVSAFDSEGKLVASGVASHKVFYSLDFTLNSLDADGNELADQSGGDILIDFDDDNDEISEPEILYRSACVVTLSTRANKGFVTKGLSVNGQSVELPHKLTLNDSIKVVATFQQDSSRVPATLTLDDGHEDLAASIATAMNTKDEGYYATADKDVVNFKVLKAQTRNDGINEVQSVLEGLGINQDSSECLLCLKNDYQSYEEWEQDMSMSKPMPDRLNLFLIWTQAIPEVNITLQSPVCGTNVSVTPATPYYDDEVQDPTPVATVAEGTVTCLGKSWISGTYSESLYEGTIEGGKEYTASIDLKERFGYKFTKDTRIYVNGEPVDMTDSSIRVPILAVHDWGESGCARCEAKRVYITFAKGHDDANGSMDAVSVGKDETYTLPAFGFTAPSGMDFAGWQVKIGNADPVTKRVGDSFAVTDNTTVTALYEASSSEPKFKNYSLTLTGQIGLNVFLDLPEVDGASYDDSYVEFTVDGRRSGRTVVVKLDPNFRDKNTGKYYGFTLPLSSIEMAQNVTATFHYRLNDADSTVTKDGITVESYIIAWLKESGITETDRALAEALADYGHHAQLFLSQTNKWTLDSDYTAMNTVFTNTYNENAIKQNLGGYTLSKYLGSSAVTKASVSLSLESETTLDIWLTAADGTEFSGVEVQRGVGAVYTRIEPESVGGRWRVRITGIRAQDLGDVITVDGNTGDSMRFSVTASPLAYINAALGSDGFATNHGHEAMCALYNYYKAAEDYIAAHSH